MNSLFSLKVLVLCLVLSCLAPHSFAASLNGSQRLPVYGEASAVPRKVTPADKARGRQASYSSDTIIVKFKKGVSETAKEKLHKKHGSKRLKAIKPLNLHHLKLKQGVSVAEALRLYQADPDVQYAEPDYTVTAAAVTPNDSYYGSFGSWGQQYLDLWGLYKIGAGDAWSLTQGSADVVVAVSDTGLDFNHPDIQDNIWTNPREGAYDGIDNDGNSFADDIHGWNFVANNNDPADDNGHGTHVSGTIAASSNNGIGIPGISWHTKIMPLKFLNSYGSGSTADGVASIIYAADNGAKVINLSWGSSMRSQALEDAINYAFNKGVVVVAAAGNSHTDATYYYPAGCENVITVGATDSNDQRASFSNYGPSVEVAAPGVDILSLRAGTTDLYRDGTHIVGTNYYRANGTSMAAPHVSGLAALLFSQYPSWSNRQVLAQIVGTTDDIGDPGIGSGRINAYSALTQASARPRVGLLRHTLDDSAGNGNGMLDPGETVKIVAYLKNYAGPANATVTLSSTDPYLTMVSASATLGTLDSWQNADNSAAPFVVAISPQAPKLHQITFTVTVSANDGSYTSTSSFSERVAVNLPGWPVQTGGYATYPVALADLDGDGAAEVVAASDKLYVLKGDGTPLPGWTQPLPYDWWWSTVSVGDLDGTGKQVIVANGYENIYARNADGTMKNGFPIKVPAAVDSDPGLLNTILADVDGDGSLEIISAAYWAGKVYAWRHDGTIVKGWPVTFDVPSGVWLPATAAAGDLDGDGKLEILVPLGDNRVGAWHADGTPVAGWPVTLPDSPVAIATADFGHDGRAKVIVSVNGGSLYGLNGDGSPMAGNWPVAGAMPAIGDIDGDGELEIVADAYQSILAYKADATVVTGWPQQHVSNTYNSPVLGDVDGDGRVDVIVRTGGGIYAWHGDGTPLPEFPLQVGTSPQISYDVAVALGDINGDGIIDLVTGSGTNDMNIYAYPLPGRYQPRLVPWAMYGHDGQRSAQLIQTPVIVSTALSGVAGVPFNRQLAARGGYGPYQWQMTGGSLPPGLSLNTATGALAGTPSEAGSFGCTVQLTDANGATSTRTLTLTIDVVAVVTDSLPPALIGTAYTQVVSAAGGTAPYSWELSAGTLPSGMTFDSATGTISGYPSVTGNFPVTLVVRDAGGNLAEKDLTVEVVPWSDKAYRWSYPESMTLDQEGNLYITGAEFNTGSTLFAGKYGPTGDLIWKRLLNGDYLTNIVVDAAGNVYVAGYDVSSAMHAFVVKYDPDGKTLWTQYQDHGMSTGLAVDAGGNVYLIGRPGRTVGNDSFLIKLDAAGSVQWAKTTIDGGPGGVAVGADGGIYASFGGAVIKYDPAGTEIWKRSYGDGSKGLAVDRDGNVVLVGYSVNKYNSAGTLLWSVTPQDLWIYGFTVDASGGVYLTGALYHGSVSDAVTVKYDAAGNLVWKKTYDRGLNEVGVALAADKDSAGVYVGGSYSDDFSVPYLLILRYVQPAVTTTMLSDARVNEPYSQQLSATRGTAPYSWSLASGALPSGLTLDSSTGVISGIPWVSGTYNVPLLVTGADGVSDLKNLPMTVTPPAMQSPADFMATPLYGQAPVMVNFSDISSNSHSTWSWMFGDGTAGTGKTATHLYTTPGTYTVSLTALGESGADLVAKTAYITVLACTSQPVRLWWSSFAGINDAYLSAGDYDLIELMNGDNGEAIELNRDIHVTLRGGYDCSYSDTLFTTYLTRTLRITAGTLTPENLRFR